MKYKYAEELLYIPSVGIQYSVIYGNGRTDLKFYHRKQINDIIINEHISMVLYEFILKYESCCNFFFCLV